MYTKFSYLFGAKSGWSRTGSNRLHWWEIGSFDADDHLAERRERPGSVREQGQCFRSDFVSFLAIGLIMILASLATKVAALRPSAMGRLDDAMWRTGKWQVAAIRVVTSANVDASAVNDHGVSSAEEALAVTAPRRDWTSCKRYHTIFSIARPQQVAAAT